MNYFSSQGQSTTSKVATDKKETLTTAAEQSKIAADQKKTSLPGQSATTNGALGEQKRAPLLEHIPEKVSH